MIDTITPRIHQSDAVCGFDNVTVRTTPRGDGKPARAELVCDTPFSPRGIIVTATGTDGSDALRVLARFCGVTP